MNRETELKLVLDEAVAAAKRAGQLIVAWSRQRVEGIPCLFVRKKAKDYGTCRLAEGGEIAKRNLVVVEDVVTLGGQIRESVKALREGGATIDQVLCVIDREMGGVENLTADGLVLHALFTHSQLKQAMAG